MGKKLTTACIAVVTGFANGLFGAGGGTLLVPAMERFLKVEAHKAHATAIAVILPLSVVSAVIYWRGGGVPLNILLYVSMGGVVGGYAGAKWLNKIPKRWLHRIFGGFMVFAAIRMIF